MKSILEIVTLQNNAFGFSSVFSGFTAFLSLTLFMIPLDSEKTMSKLEVYFQHLLY